MTQKAKVLAGVLAQEGITNPAVKGSINLGKAIPAFTDIFIFLGGLVCLLYLVLAGIMWITAGGDTKKTGEAGKQITNALIGLGLLASGWAIISFVDKFLHLNILTGGIKIPRLFEP
jgi:hypothetical protein